MSSGITLSEVWINTIRPFYEENGRMLYSRLLTENENENKGKAFIRKSVPKYDWPRILFQAFPTPTPQASSDDKGKRAKVFLDNATDKNGSKYVNMALVMESINQDQLGGLEEDLGHLFHDSVALSLYSGIHYSAPNTARLQGFAASYEGQIMQRLSPKLATLANNLRLHFADVFAYYGFDLQYIGQDNSIQYLTLLMALAVSELTPPAKPNEKLKSERHKLEINIKAYYEGINRPKRLFASNLLISPCETYIPTHELDDLVHYFCNSMDESKIGLIYGMSGCGKSTLARAFAQEAHGKYDAIIWTHYISTDGFRGILEQIPMQNSDASTEEKIYALRSCEQKVLIIIDNFDEKDCHEPLPRWGNTHLLFTSRYLADSFAKAAKIFPVDCNKPLSLAIFESVFSRITNQKISQQQLLVADRILATVNYHTYATDLIAREVAENYSAENDITCYEQYLHSIWAGVEVESRKDRFVGMAAKEATFDAHIELLFEDILSRTKASPCDQSIMFLFSMHNRWKRETITMLLGDSKTKGRLKVSKSILQLLKKNILQEEVLTDRYYGITEHILSIHPLFLRAAKIGLSWDTECEIQKTINNFCAQWNNAEGIHGTHSWLDRDQWPVEYSHRVDHWVQVTTSSYLSGNSTWDARLSLAVCFMLQPFCSTSTFVEIIKKCLAKHTGQSVHTYFLCSTEVSNGRHYFIHIPEFETDIPLITCDLSYELPPCSDSNQEYGEIALRNVVADQENLVIPGYIGGHPVRSIWYVFAHERNYKHSVQFDFRGFIKLQPGDIFRQAQTGVKLKTVLFEEGVQEIHSFAFAGLELETVHLPDTLLHIGSQAFSANKGLREIEIPEGITIIPEGCFFGCSSLSCIFLPSSLITIGLCAFGECTSLTSVSLRSKGPVYVGEESFGYDSQLKNIWIHAEKIDVAERAFVSCQNLEAALITANVVQIKPTAFVYCPKLRSIDVQSIDGDKVRELLRVAACGSDVEIQNAVFGERRIEKR